MRRRKRTTLASAGSSRSRRHFGWLRFQAGHSPGNPVCRCLRGGFTCLCPCHCRHCRRRRRCWRRYRCVRRPPRASRRSGATPARYVPPPAAHKTKVGSSCRGRSDISKWSDTHTGSAIRPRPSHAGQPHNKHSTKTLTPEPARRPARARCTWKIPTTFSCE